MLDPLEGVAPDGTIATGARRDRVPAAFEPALDAVVQAVEASGPDNSLYLYGSVATGQAAVGRSDVDLLTIGWADDEASAIGNELSDRFADVCRAVEIGAGDAAGFVGDHDEAYGNRVFLHHYCVRLAGPEHDRATAPFPADRRAARGFNGDIARHLGRWRTAQRAGGDPGLGRRIARKTLLAVAGLVSVHDRTWTTDRVTAAGRWGTLRPDLATALETLTRWSDRNEADPPADGAIVAMLDGPAAAIAESFEETIGLWG